LFRFSVLQVLCVAGLLLPLPTYAQFSSSGASFLPDSNASQPFSLEVPLSSAAQPDATAAKPKARLGALTTGWTYLWADQGGYRANLNGWFLRPSINFGKGYSVFFDSTNYYGTNAKGSVNSHGFTFGAGRQFFSHAKMKPSLFAEAGDVRSSSAGTITNQFVFATGFSVSVPLNQHVELAITPAEYIFLYPKSTVRNDYNAKVGLSFPFGRR
jgi:hypothetical protein